jgi:hypothetical protein
MSHENVELVRQLYELRPADMADVGAWRELFDPDVEWLPAAQSLLAGDSYQGPEGVSRFWADLMSGWEDYRVEPREFRDLGDHVVVVMRIHARAARGIEIDETWSSLWTLRNGKVIRFQGFTDRDGALEAAGLGA